MSKLVTQYNANVNEAHFALLGKNLFLTLDYESACKISEFIKDIEAEIQKKICNELSEELFNISERYAR